jgi:hypothetical protein
MIVMPGRVDWAGTGWGKAASASMKITSKISMRDGFCMKTSGFQRFMDKDYLMRNKMALSSRKINFQASLFQLQLAFHNQRKIHSGLS